MKKYKYALIISALVALPFLAGACPLCQAGATPKTENAYLETTAILALIPVLGGGSIFYWLYSKGKKGDGKDE